MLDVLVAGLRAARDQTYLLGWLYVPQRDADEAANVEQHSRVDDSRARPFCRDLNARQNVAYGSNWNFLILWLDVASKPNQNRAEDRSHSDGLGFFWNQK